MKNVVIYVCCLGNAKTEENVEQQLKSCSDYAEKEGFTVVNTYIDTVDTHIGDRPQFQKMIDDSRRKQFQFVLVYQFDRFAENRYDSANYKHKLKKTGVKVISVRENISEDASGILMESILEAMAEYYSAELSRKIKRGIALKKQRQLVSEK